MKIDFFLSNLHMCTCVCAHLWETIYLHYFTPYTRLKCPNIFAQMCFHYQIIVSLYLLACHVTLRYIDQDICLDQNIQQTRRPESIMIPKKFSRGQKSLQWRHNEHDGVSNHRPHDCNLIVYVIMFTDGASMVAGSAICNLWVVSIWSCHLTNIGIPIIKMRRSHDRLISIMRFPYREKRSLHWDRPCVRRQMMAPNRLSNLEHKLYMIWWDVVTLSENGIPLTLWWAPHKQSNVSISINSTMSYIDDAIWLRTWTFPSRAKLFCQLPPELEVLEGYGLSPWHPLMGPLSRSPMFKSLVPERCGSKFKSIISLWTCPQVNSTDHYWSGTTKSPQKFCCNC